MKQYDFIQVFRQWKRSLASSLFVYLNVYHVKILSFQHKHICFSTNLTYSKQDSTNTAAQHVVDPGQRGQVLIYRSGGDNYFFNFDMHYSCYDTYLINNY